jgi:CHRD domain
MTAAHCHLNLRVLPVSLIIAMTLCSSASSHVFHYAALLNGASEATPNSSPAMGTALVKLNIDVLVMDVDVTFSGLVGDILAADIHAATSMPLTGTSIVATPLPEFSAAGSSGTYERAINLTEESSFDPAFLSNHGSLLFQAINALIFALDERKAYLSIKTSAFPNGEIRGFLIHLPGDFNHNLVVDAADYVVWRESLGDVGEGLAADSNNDNMIDEADYAFWQQNFGRTGFDSGAGRGAAHIPEPAPLALVILGVSLFILRRPRFAPK